MQVFIINQQLNHEKQYQIMIKNNNCFYHVYPGKLYTVEEAKTICNNNNFTVVMIGTFYQCI